MTAFSLKHRGDLRTKPSQAAATPDCESTVTPMPAGRWGQKDRSTSVYVCMVCRRSSKLVSLLHSWWPISGYKQMTDCGDHDCLMSPNDPVFLGEMTDFFFSLETPYVRFQHAWGECCELLWLKKN